MCGFAGQLRFDGIDAAVAGRRMERALDRLAPRGPDGAGRWHDDRTVLGHRRLAIVDLSDAGAQPLVRDGVALVFNGMIYNYRALRAELAGRGHRFGSDCDTEVLLAGWREWGEGLLPKMEGMFAFAVWEPASGTLTLARDRMGKKPLCYRADAAGCSFASDLRALQMIDGRKGEIDTVSRRLFFALRYVPEPRTILSGVAKVPPGGIVTITPKGASVRRWHVPATAHTVPEDDPAAVLRGLVEQAVADRLVADVPVGAFLSGGIDSAIVAACMARAGAAVRTFTVGFEGVADYYEERPAARAVAAHLGTAHTEISVTPEETLAVIGRVFDGLDEPFADSSAIPTYLVSRETRRHVTVALSGDGADEIFGGYRKYQGELLAGRYQNIPRPVRRGLIEPLFRALPEGKHSRLLEKARRARRFVAHAGGGAVARQAGWMRLLADSQLDRLLGPGSAATGAEMGVEALVEAARDAAGTDDPINRMLAADSAIGLPGDMLAKVDRMSMANGLEVRCPMLDSRVVAYAAALPGALKLQRGRGKAILRDAFADALPPGVFALPKKGFEVPVATWLNGPLSEWVDAAIDPARLGARGLGGADLARGWRDALAGGRRDTSAELWTLIAYHAWCDRQDALDLPA